MLALFNSCFFCQHSSSRIRLLVSGDKDLPRGNEVQGYQPVSRIGEVVMNSFIDAVRSAPCAIPPS